MTETPKPLVLFAPAKINLHLRVVGRRDDGYHLLETILVPVSLFDEVRIEPAASGGVRLAVEGKREGVPDGPANLAWRAAETFSGSTGITVHARIRLTKRIPVAAGLGGGSSDAAAVLAGLNRLHGDPLDSCGLRMAAVRLGADVPFFLHGGAAVARGIGEVLSPFHLPGNTWFLLVYPGFPILASAVYRELNYRLTNQEPEAIVPPSVVRGTGLLSILHNDLQPVVLRSHPEVEKLFLFLESRVSRRALMSGSGPTVFGVLSAKQEGRELKEEIEREENGWSCFLVRNIEWRDLLLGVERWKSPR